MRAYTSIDLTTAIAVKTQYSKVALDSLVPEPPIII